MTFEFATATTIVFGAGTSRSIGDRVRAHGSRVLLVTGRDAGRAGVVRASLGSAGVDCVGYAVPGEPTLDAAREGTALGRREDVSAVVSCGGGSAIDLGKAVAALLANDGDPLEYVEVIGRGATLRARARPFFAVPTTAGTGAEVTRNAVLASPADGIKVSLRSPLLLPTAAIVDPDLTLDLPPALTAATGMDALTQLVEPYVSVRANPMTDALCIDGMARAARALPRAFAAGSDRAARTDMALASLLGGLALANAGLGAVHGFAAAIGGRFDAPHGAVCAALLPGVVAANISALRRTGDPGRRLPRYETVARLLTGREAAGTDAVVAWLHELSNALAIPPLAQYGLTPADVDGLVAAATRSSSMKANPVVLTPDELAGVLHDVM